jgi:hypothetical protein
MKKWMYLIFPGIMLAGFLAVYVTHKKESEERELLRAQKVAEEQATAAKKRADSEAKAAKEAKDRQLATEKELADKEAARVARQAAADKEVIDETNRSIARGDVAAKQIATLEIELDTLHKAKDKASRDAFETAKKVELARIARRNAELEIQRMTEMVSRKTQESFLLRLPPPPPPPKS